jgi:chemotaxis protein methyltransferase CheR
MNRRWRIETALASVLRDRGIPTLDELITILVMGREPALANQVVEALLNNETYFFRDRAPFDLLARSALPDLAIRRAQSRKIRIWSAGCSTGQEPYTIALSLLAAHPELKRWDFKILATDIDTSVIAKAAAAVYPEGELNGLSPERARLFERMGDGRIRVPPAVAQRVSFKPLNLMAPWPMRGPFDAIFCRNVAIYFDKPTQGEVFGRLGNILAPGGYLYIGHSENLGSGSAGFRLVGKTIYQARTLAERAKDAA